MELRTRDTHGRLCQVAHGLVGKELRYLELWKEGGGDLFLPTVTMPVSMLSPLKKINHNFSLLINHYYPVE